MQRAPIFDPKRSYSVRPASRNVCMRIGRYFHAQRSQTLRGEARKLCWAKRLAGDLQPCSSPKKQQRKARVSFLQHEFMLTERLLVVESGMHRPSAEEATVQIDFRCAAAHGVFSQRRPPHRRYPGSASALARARRRRSLGVTFHRRLVSLELNKYPHRIFRPHAGTFPLENKHLDDGAILSCALLFGFTLQVVVDLAWPDHILRKKI